MTRPNITPGEWKNSGFEQKTERIIIESDAAQICSVYMPSCFITRDANARAIAAVPVLLAALERAHGLIGDLAQGATLTGTNLVTWAKTAAVLLPKEAAKVQSALALAGYTF